MLGAVNWFYHTTSSVDSIHSASPAPIKLTRVDTPAAAAKKHTKAKTLSSRLRPIMFSSDLRSLRFMQRRALRTQPFPLAIVLPHPQIHPAQTSGFFVSSDKQQQRHWSRTCHNAPTRRCPRRFNFRHGRSRKRKLFHFCVSFRDKSNNGFHRNSSGTAPGCTSVQLNDQNCPTTKLDYLAFAETSINIARTMNRFGAAPI